ncbi:MAG: hypothetical protein EA373_11000 [Oceanospirillales bacterium]|nr:MAG: hypothetical protein EA373_11000 [Oceanospirillales bacterium]
MNASATVLRQSGQKKKNNTLAFCVDEGYLPYALFVAEQFIACYDELPCDICICLPDMDAVPEKFLKSDIRFIEFSVEGIDSLPVGQLSLASYHRLFLPQMFDGIYEYILYLDADTFINRPFYDELMCVVDALDEDFCVAAATDISELVLRSTKGLESRVPDEYFGAYHQFDHIYRNAGVLVFNTRNFNRKESFNKVFTYVSENVSKLRCHDQSALNGALLKEMAFLPFAFNWQMHKLTLDILDDANPYIIHFISENKPWSLDNRFTRRYQPYYKEYLNLNFPERVLDIISVYERRNLFPKYSNPLREYFSKNIVRIKDLMVGINSIKMTNNSDQCVRRDILKNYPFMVDHFDITYKKGSKR